MCGIAGAVGARDGAAVVARMVGRLHHRGPDDSGIECVGAGDSRAAVRNARLAIVDLSAAGHMPMGDPETGNWITHNGEIYCFLELRRELEGAGERFRSATDTEVILKAYKRWGRECVGRFRGMFAFAIWDHARRELFLARDRLGKNPLYYCRIVSGAFVFASEVRSLWASGLVACRLDREPLESFPANGFLITPRTLVRGVRGLLSCHWMRVGIDGRVPEARRYWRLPGADTSSPPVSAPIVEVRRQLEEAVRLRLVSDVRLGAFLSGGLDASAIVALMARAGGDVRTFAIAFEEEAYDESTFSCWVAMRK